MLSTTKAQKMMAIAKERGSHFFEWTHKKTDETEFFADVLLTKTKFGGRELMQATVRDITERKQAEAAVRENEQRLELAMKGGELGMWDWQVQRGRVIYNARWADMLGYAPDDLGVDMETWENLVHPDDLLRIWKDLNEHLEGRTPFFEGEHRLRTKSGKWKWVLGRGKVFDRDKDGKPVRMAGTNLDITNIKKNEGKILRQTALLDGINRVFREGVTSKTEEDVAKTYLAVAEELTGSKFGFLGELNSEGLFDTTAISNPGWDACKVPGSEATRLIQNMELRGVDRSTMKEGKSRIVTDIASHPDSCGLPKGHPEITSFLGVPLKQNGKTTGLIALANKETGYDRDDQETVEVLGMAFVEALSRKRAELALKKHEEHLGELVEMRTAELKKSQAQLIEVEKMGALGTLTAGIAHELNNPLMGMLNFAQYCLKHIPQSDKTYSVLQDTRRETERCIGIVKNLLSFSRIEEEGEEQYQKEHITALLDRVFSLLAYRIEKESVVVEKTIAEELPKIPMKVSNLQQVFLNLIGNALDALKESEKKELHLDIRNDAEFLRVKIKDTGPGISSEDLLRIFDPFFTTKPPGKGTGLGLSVSHGIVKDHKGEILCESEPGTGTAFEVLLPMKGNE